MHLRFMKVLQSQDQPTLVKRKLITSSIQFMVLSSHHYVSREIQSNYVKFSSIRLS